MWLFEGTQKSDWESDSILEMNDCFRSSGIGESELVYIDLYRNYGGLVNQIEGFGCWCYVKISQIRSNSRYVDDNPTLVKIQIS